MKTIFNVYVEMDSQATCDRMKQLCVDNGLPILNKKVYDGFEFVEYFRYFSFGKASTDRFEIWNHATIYFTKATETEFIELLKQYKNDNI